MTIDRIVLKDLVEKGSDADLLREMIAFVAARMMELDVETLTGAAHGAGSYAAPCQPGRKSQPVRHLGIEVDDAIEIAEKIDI